MDILLAEVTAKLRAIPKAQRGYFLSILNAYILGATYGWNKQENEGELK